MATTVWTVVDTVWCERQGQHAQLLEQRVYPAEVLPGVEPAFQVRARKCSFDVDCNLAGFTCRWAFNNPNYDPFQ
jgi:hypothetical protein